MKFTADEMLILCANHCGTRSETITLVKKIVPKLNPKSPGKENLSKSLIDKFSKLKADEPIELAFDDE